MKYSGKADLLWVSSNSTSIAHGIFLNIVEVATNVWLLDLPLSHVERGRLRGPSEQRTVPCNLQHTR